MKISKTNFKKTYKFLPVFLIPFLLVIGFFSLYQSGFGLMFAQTLSIYKAFLSGVAALCFFIYLQKRTTALNPSYIWQVLLSVAYGLCSHALIPSTTYETLLIFSLLPILFLFFEDFMSTKKTLYLYICVTIFLLIEPVTTTSILLGLLVVFLFQSPAKKGAFIADLLHFITIVIFSICTTAMFSLPAYKEYFDAFTDYGYSGFHPTLSLSNFFSRFYAGAIPTTHYAVSRNISLYFGLFFLMLAVLYFFCTKIPLKERLRNLFIVSILLGVLELSALQYIFDLFTANQSIFIPFESLTIFFCLLLAEHALANIKEFTLSGFISGLLCVALITLFALSGSYLNFHSVALSSNFLFLALYTIILILLWKKPQIGIVHTLVYLFIGIELVCNLFLVTNQNIFPSTAMSQTQFVWESSSPETTVDTATITTGMTTESAMTPQEKYNTFTEEHTDYVLVNVMSTLLDEVELTDEDCLSYNEYGLLNPLDEVNAICRKIGTSGDLFIPCALTTIYPESEYYAITDQGGGVYNLFQYKIQEGNSHVYIDYTFSADADGIIVIYDTMTGTAKYFDNYKAGTLEGSMLYANANTDYSYNFHLAAYQMDPAVYDEIPDLLVAYKEAELAGAFSLDIYYVSLILTVVSIFVLLLLYVDKKDKQIKTALNRCKERIASLTVWKRICTHIGYNYVYYLAFFIPVLLYVLTMIVFNCIPFGPYSFFDEDGISSALPSIMGGYYNTKYDNTIFSPIAGYGYSPYASNNTFFLRALLNPFAASSIPVITLFFEAIFMGMTALSMAFYLTHRLSGQKAKKGDYRILVAACIYALNTYMLAVHCFPTWYYVFMAFPLLMLGYDRLMYKKAWGLYVFALSLCMFTNIHLSIFVCIFLVILFFTYRFNGWKDFFAKGIRFAFFSLLTAGCNFFRLVDTFLSKTNSFYQENDSVSPTFGLFTSFWDQWKQLFVFTPSLAVNRDNGYINLYMGIFTLILLGIYITSKKITVKEKLCKLIPILILTISFNENVLSFIWNGFHYQSNVPNRYVFLLLYLCAVMGYDALRELRDISTKRYLAISCLLAIFLALCQVFESNTTFAFVSTLVLLALYMGIFVLLRKKRLVLQRILCGILLLELCANMFFTVSHYSLFNYVFITGFEEVSEFANTRLKKDNSPGRISSPGSFQINMGMIYNVPSGSIFNSFVSSYQSTTHYTYGFLGGDNYTTYNYNSSPLGLALSGHKYIFLPEYTTVALKDNRQYQYIGNCENYFVYENPDVLSVGFYVPETIREMPTDGISAHFHNEFVALYTSDDKPIYQLKTLTYSEDVTTTPNSFSFSDRNMNPVTPEKAQELVDTNAGTTMMFSIPELFIHMNLEPETSGDAYFFLNEFVPIGNINEGESTIIKTPYPNPSLQLETEYEYFVFNQDIFDEFMAVASENQMENVVIDNNRITGTTHYKENGYTLLSIPYDDGWRAYIDSVEVDVLVPYDTFIMFETPAGDHEIELVYERANIKTGIYGTLAFILVAILVRTIETLYKRNKKKKERL